MKKSFWEKAQKMPHLSIEHYIKRMNHSIYFICKKSCLTSFYDYKKVFKDFIWYCLLHTKWYTSIISYELRLVYSDCLNKIKINDWNFFKGNIEVTIENVQELIVAADMLALSEIVHICTNFLKRELTAANSVGIYR